MIPVIYLQLIGCTYQISDIAWETKSLLQKYGIDSNFVNEIIFLQVDIRNFIIKPSKI
jgi:hypothetical protein